MDQQLPIKLRPACLQDAAAIANLQCVTWRAAYEGIMPKSFLALAQMDVKAVTANWQGALSGAGPGRYLVASVNNAVVAFATYGPAREAAFAGAGELVALNVHPKYWRCGIGAMLLTAVESALRDSYPQLYLWVATKNERAQQFYRHHNFAHFGDLRPSPYIPKMREQAMIKALR